MVATLKKFDFTGKEIGSLAIKDDDLQSSVSSQMIKDYIVAIRNNARQWSANTKTRAEVNHSGQKPHAQKGMGRARQGYLAAPQYKGGGRVGGPRPKIDQHVRMNQKERRAAVRHLLIEKIRESHFYILSLKSKQISKTKQVAKFFEAIGLQEKKVLFLSTLSAKEKGEEWKRFQRNIPKTEFLYLSHVNGYDLANYPYILLIEDAEKELLDLLIQEKGK
jgi:large subunit ribosomal protein L4